MNIKERLFSKVKVRRNGCWEWTGALSNKGYGRFRIGKKLYLPHRVVYELTYGKIDKDKEICHKCDNPLCVNPTHLFMGTHSDNMKDCFKKGRLVIPINNRKGEQVGNSKLKDADILKIRELDKTMYRKDIAKLYDVHGTQISRCLNGISFKHIPK